MELVSLGIKIFLAANYNRVQYVVQYMVNYVIETCFGFSK